MTVTEPVWACRHLRQSTVLLMQGLPEGAIAEAEQVVDARGLTDELYVDGELILMEAMTAAGRHASAERRSVAILGVSNLHGGDGALAGAFATIAYRAWDDGRLHEALAFIRAAARRAAARGSAVGPRYFQLVLAAMLTSIGDLKGSASAIEEVPQGVRLAQDPALTTLALMISARLNLASGLITEATSQARAGLALGEDKGIRVLEPMGRAVLALAALVDGDLGEARRQLRRTPVLPPDVGPLGWAINGWAVARLVEAEEGPAAGLVCLGRSCEVRGRSHRRILESSAVAPWWVRVSLAAQDHQQAVAVVAIAEELAKGNPGLDAVEVAAAHAGGLLSRNPASLDDAAMHHVDPWGRASAEEDAAGVLVATNPAAAGVRFGKAATSYEEAGAKRDARRVRAAFGDLGRRRHQARVVRPLSGLASLTEAERRVASLVTTGLTNAEAAKRLCLSQHRSVFIFGRCIGSWTSTPVLS